MDNSFQQKNKADLDKVVTLGLLLEYTDEFLIPKMSEMMDEKIATSERRMDLALGKFNNSLINLITEKQADTVSEIFIRLDKKYQREKQFKEKVLDLFKRHNIGTAEDLAYLEGLVAG